MSQVTSATIRALLRAHLAESEYALAFEVSDMAKGAQRRADAVAMGLWPSRGLPIHGYEFKVSRQDWRAELRNPAKAEAIGQWCDMWWLVTAPRVIKPGELPDLWGHMEVQDGKLVVVKEAPRKEAQPIDRRFMASLFRRLSIVDNDDFARALEMRVELKRSELAEQYAKDARDNETRFEGRIAETKARYERTMERVADFEALTGLPLDQLSRYGNDLGQAVRFVLDSKIFGTYRSVEALRNELARSLAVLDDALAPKEKTVAMAEIA